MGLPSPVIAVERGNLIPLRTSSVKNLFIPLLFMVPTSYIVIDGKRVKRYNCSGGVHLRLISFMVPISYIADAPWLRYNTAKMKNLGQETHCSSDVAVRQAIKDILSR